MSEILKWRSPSEANENRPSREEAMEAVRTLIAWAGDDPEREGLKDTPKRVVDAYREWFRGYDECPADELNRVFEDVSGYDDMVMLKKIDVESHCEHHMAPFLGKAYVAYLPTDAVVGISKIARVVEIFAKRLQTQETMTAQIAEHPGPLRVGIGHADAPGSAHALERSLRALPNVTETIRYLVGPSVAAHTGAGTFGAVYHPI